jgi:eukaryotic-like serine/threonine-protein kinase
MTRSMALTQGRKLGPYEILATLGAGGMGEVYRARDTKLGRAAALKVLPEVFASDAQCVARLRREAQLLASLNHSNIAAIYGFEDSCNVHALVMELVEGPTLVERIKSAAIPLDEALHLAKQICEAVEYAHERGVIHRDLKPANIKLASNDSIKVLDFGLAKALEGDAPSTDISSSPTISRMATQAGIILGTAAYMSPEQAKGKSVDRRTDIWAFGCVLYEMVTGKMVFSGETVTDTLAAVIKSEPDWKLLPAATPARIRDMLQRCLKKDPRQRLQAIGDARIAIEETLSDATGSTAAAGVLPGMPAQNKWRRALPWYVIGGLAIALALAVVGYVLRAPQPARAIVSEISSPANTKFAFGGNTAGPPVISPDGQRLAFTAVGSDGRYLLWVRPLNAATAHPLEGTEGATFPFWSSDSRYVGFFANGKLNRMDASGGQPLAIADATDGRGGSWGADGTILFTPDTISPIYRVSSSGGTPQPVTKLNALRQEVSHRWPEFLPDTKHFLFYVHCNAPQNNGIYAASLDGSEPKLLVHSDFSNAVYAPPGYLLFVRQGTLMAQRFDANSMSLIGDAMPLAEQGGVKVSAVFWRGLFTVSGNGLLACQVGNSVMDSGQLLWFDRSGEQIGEKGTPSYFAMASLSPDGSKLAAEIGVSGTTFNIWVLDRARGIRTRLTFSSSIDAAPSWSPDGKTIAFASNLNGQFHLYQKAADGTGSTLPLVVDNAGENEPSFSTDGRYLIFRRLAATPGSHAEIWALPLFGDRKAFPVVQSPQFDLTAPALSPDGKWLAYTSHETGRPEIYVVPFGHGSGKWEVSTDSGMLPRWRHDGRELFYLSLDNKIMSAEISEQGASLVIGKVAPLFQVDPVTIVHWPYDVSADGRKFVVITQGAQQSSAPLTLVVNWPALLKK